MMFLLTILLLSLISQADAIPAAGINNSFSTLTSLTSLTDGVHLTTLPNGTVIFENVTAGDERVSWLNKPNPYSTWFFPMPSTNHCFIFAAAVQKDLTMLNSSTSIGNTPTMTSASGS
ncbi:hypothetical protein PC116_g34108 [Phytophthora cactorum]|nr:hypothetical protein PC116_g34108 [Phytophthora cactorum]